MPPVRRLTAILAADVAGYSRLMGADEEGTLDQLKTLRRELSDPKIKEHRGRIVKTTGDGLLIEFGSVVDAVRCAVEVQREMAERNAGVPSDRRIEFRMGINLGDIIRDGRDIYGDGVNIAARLEALAEPGGICVSRVVRDQVRDKVDFGFEDQGERQLKNIARPVRVYAFRPDAVAAPPAPKVSVALLSSQPAGAPRLSIVVLPFTNLSDDREQQYFADGITEDLTTDLSRIAGMIVISRNTAFTYRNKPVDTKQIGRELGVRYVLEGSVRRSGSRVRVNAQLIEAETNAHLWAERFDRDTADLFALQDEVTSRIGIALNVELVSAAAARLTDNPDAMEYFLRGRAIHASRVSTRATYAASISMYDRALALDPQYAAAQSALAIRLVGRALDGMADSAAADIARAESLANKALAASPRSPAAHFVKGQVLRARATVLGEDGRCEEAIAEYEVAVSLDRNLVFAMTALGLCKFLTGSMGELIPRIEQAIRLSPRDKDLPVWWDWIGRVHLLQSQPDEAVAWLEKARNANPEYLSPHAWLAASYALKGETGRAAAELAEARRLSTDARFESIARLRAASYFGVPKVRAVYEATYLTGLRKAGMPEE